MLEAVIDSSLIVRAAAASIHPLLATIGLIKNILQDLEGERSSYFKIDQAKLVTVKN